MLAYFDAGHPAGPPVAVPPAARARFGEISVLPNPFNPRTTIRFQTARPGDYRVCVYSLRGERIAVLR